MLHSVNNRPSSYTIFWTADGGLAKQPRTLLPSILNTRLCTHPTTPQVPTRYFEHTVVHSPNNPHPPTQYFEHPMVHSPNNPLPPTQYFEHPVVQSVYNRPASYPVFRTPDGALSHQPPSLFPSILNTRWCTQPPTQYVSDRQTDRQILIRSINSSRSICSVLTTQLYTPDGMKLQQHLCANLKYHKQFPTLYRTRSSLPCSQQPATGPHSQPVYST